MDTDCLAICFLREYNRINGQLEDGTELQHTEPSPVLVLIELTVNWRTAQNCSTQNRPLC